jgi:hypothetical protein
MTQSYPNPVHILTAREGPTNGSRKEGLAMKYMLLIYAPESDYAPGEREACMLESSLLIDELVARGQFLAASPLHPVATATSIRVREGRRLVTDGPFAETHEQLGGYYLIEVDHLDEAMEIAARIPGAKKGTVEIRPVETVDREALERDARQRGDASGCSSS